MGSVQSARTARLRGVVVRGAVFGMIAGMMMAMVAMVAAVTYQHHGFFTPLFHISALTGTPTAMMTSMMHAAAGDNFWFTPGAALAGLVIHMVTGAMFGVGFMVLATRVPRAWLVPAGAMYGLAVFAFSAFVGLPVAAAISGAGDSISDMGTMVGYGTFALEHVVFGMTLGVLAFVTAPRVVRRPQPERELASSAA